MKKQVLYLCFLVAIVACKKNNGGDTSLISTATCGADSVHNPSLTYGSMTDQDGNVYKTIQIGTQTWMAENLKSAHYRNGDRIPVVTDSLIWENLTTGATCWYNNDSATYNCPYGRLYNWYALADSRKVCPAGWHVPSDAEWNILVKYIDSAADTTCSDCDHSAIAGGKMKSTGTLYWLSPNVAADNNSGFSALSGGARNYDGNFSTLGYICGWWSSSEVDMNSAWVRGLFSDWGGEVSGDPPKVNGFSVRCLRD